MDSPIDEIKERLDIVDVISSYIKLEKTGANYRALCPFHSEKKPSFFVSPARQIFKCFGCLKGGNIFQFVMDIEGVEFGDALRILAKRAGVELRRQDPEVQTARKRFYELCELAAKFFEKQLYEGKIGQKAKHYLLKRGLTEHSIKRWRIGFAPDAWQSLITFLKQKGFSVGEIQRAGLSSESEKGKVYDRFRGRIIFPIFDLNSQVIGFGGRVFVQKENKETAKYLNIPNTLLYNKSRVLYGLNKAKVPVRKEDSCILVEGYTDVIMSHQAGVENVVATSGTALAPSQLLILKRYSKNLITAFDMDIAGDSATKRGIDLAQAQGFDIRVVQMPEGNDPADISQDKDNWKKIIKEAKSILEFYFDNAFAKYDSKTPQGKRNISQMVIPVIKRVQNKIEQSSWVKELAKRLAVSEESVFEELRKHSPEQKVDVKEEVAAVLEKKSRKELIEEKILSLILNYPQGLKLLNKESLQYFSPKNREILLKLKKEPKSLEKIDFPKEIKEFLDFLTLKGEVEIELSEGEIDFEQELLVCLRELECLTIREQMSALTEKIREAEIKKDLKTVEKLSKEFSQLAKKLSQKNNQ